jgi:hypothetical protein
MRSMNIILFARRSTIGGPQMMQSFAQLLARMASIQRGSCLHFSGRSSAGEISILLTAGISVHLPGKSFHFTFEPAPNLMNERSSMRRILHICQRTLSVQKAMRVLEWEMRVF